MAMAGAVFILIALMSMSITAGTFFSRVFGVARPFGFGIQTQLYPVLAARFMRESGLRGNLFHNYDSGGYLIWHLHPNVKTCIDGRAEPFPIGMIKEHWRIFSADSDPHGFMEKYGMDLALIDFDDRGLLKYFKGRPQWALCHIGERTALFVKRTDAQASFIEQYEIPPPEKSGAAKARLVFPPPGETAKIFPYTSSEILAARRGAMLEELGYPGGWALPVTNTDGHP